MSFDPSNCPLKIQKSIGILILKVRVHLGMWGFISSHSPTLLGTWNVTPKLHPCFGRKPKARVVTIIVHYYSNHIFIWSPNPTSTFCFSHTSFSMHFMSLMSIQLGCKNFPHFLQHAKSCKCMWKQLRWYKWPQDTISMSMYGN
jgi:hypothetical protein